MYIIVKDVYDNYGNEAKRVVVLNRAARSEALMSKNRALMLLKEIIEDIGEEYEKLNDSKYGSAYSLWGGREIFYVFELYVDKSL